MAPTAPNKRPSIRSKASKTSSKPSFSAAPKPNPGSGAISRSRSSASTTSSPFFPSSSSTFTNTKSDKRIIKHSAFVSRIEKSTSKKALKRRRPNKKLVTTLEGLADALPDVEELVRRNESGQGGKKLESKSLSHGRGFMKRRDKVEKGEKERFGKNLGVIMGSSVGENVQVKAGEGGEGNVVPKPASATAGRFAAIRAWVNDNMEKHEGFEKKG